MFDRAGRLKVLDFGLAKMLADSATTPDDATIHYSRHVDGTILALSRGKTYRDVVLLKGFR